MARLQSEAGVSIAGMDDPDLPLELAAVLHQMIKQRDPYTATHMSRVESLSLSIATRLKLDTHTVEGLRVGARLHDLGKFSIPFDILNKPGRLSHQELELVREHAQRGFDIASRLTWSWPVPEMLFQHHERMDGSGYPLGIGGQNILLEAKIIAVTDLADAMLSHRPYRPALPHTLVAETLRKGRAILLDSDAVDACLELFEDSDFELPADETDISQTADRS